MIVVFEYEVSNLKRLIARLFSKPEVHCFAAFKNECFGYYVYDHFGGRLKEGWRPSLPAGATIKELPVMRAEFLQEFNKIAGSEYDYIGVSGIATGLDTDNPNRWFCSEWIEYFLNRFGIIDRIMKRTPAALKRVLFL